MVGMNVTRGALAGHEAPGGQRGPEEQPPTATTPATSAVTRPVGRASVSARFPATFDLRDFLPRLIYLPSSVGVQESPAKAPGTTRNSIWER
jgi:hypothetical protein